MWLSEGFATYFAGLFVQRYEGEEAFQQYMKKRRRMCLRMRRRSRMPIFDRDTEDLLELLNANNYQKGSWVLHMLRSNLGDEVFFRGIGTTTKRTRTSTASTEDLRAALEKASGKDLRAFFARWVYDSGHPQYELSWQWLRKTASCGWSSEASPTRQRVSRSGADHHHNRERQARHRAEAHRKTIDRNDSLA